MLLTAAILSLISSTFALPSGAPICRLGGETGGFEKAHGKATSGMKNPLSVLFVKGLTADIRIEGPYRGLLLWVDEVQMTKEFAPQKYDNKGNFSSASGLRPVNGCSAMTHKDASVLKSITSKITWTAKKAGRYEVHAVVFKDQATWAEFKQIIVIKQTSNSDPSPGSQVVPSVPPKSSYGASAQAAGPRKVTRPLQVAPAVQVAPALQEAPAEPMPGYSGETAYGYPRKTNRKKGKKRRQGKPKKQRYWAVLSQNYSQGSSGY
jgi:hypothetical protein